MILVILATSRFIVVLYPTSYRPYRIMQSEYSKSKPLL